MKVIIFLTTIVYSALLQSLLIDGEISCINSSISSEDINCKTSLRLGLDLCTWPGARARCIHAWARSLPIIKLSSFTQFLWLTLRSRGGGGGIKSKCQLDDKKSNVGYGYVPLIWSYSYI